MTGKLQMTMFGQKSEWVPPLEFPNIFNAPEIAIDVETRDPNLKNKGPGWPTKDGEIVGYAVAVAGAKWYFPVGHLGGGNLDRRLVEKFMRKVCECPADKIMHNASYDLGWLRATGFKVNGRIIDTMLAMSLIDENRFSYSLNAVCYDLLGKTKSEKTLVQAAKEFGVDPKGEMWKLPSAFVGPYGEVDAEITLELWHHLKKIIAREDLSTIWDLESRLQPYLVEMTMRGIRVDLDRADRTKHQVIKREKELIKRIKTMCKAPVEIWAAQSIAKAFDEHGLEYPKTDRGAPSFTKSFLTAHPHELPQLIVQARNLNKISGSFIDGILKYVKDGRIHSHINQNRSDDGGTVSGRMCVGRETKIETPDGFKTIDCIKKGDKVKSPTGWSIVTRGGFEKGPELMYTIHLSGGGKLRCTANHRFLCGDGVWRRLHECVEDIYAGEEIVISKDFGRLLSGRHAYGSGVGEKILDYAAQHSSCVEDDPRYWRIKKAACIETFPVEEGYAKPYERQEKRAASQLEGRVLGRQRIPDGTRSRMVDRDGTESFCAQGSYGASAWNVRASEAFGRPSHRRGPDQQPSRQFDGRDEIGSPTFAPRVAITKVVPCGIDEVWDLSVEGGAYVAEGVIHHNSYNSPNLQQIPARDPELGPMIRSLFLPEEGCQWAAIDYSQQEPRALVHFAKVYGDYTGIPMGGVEEFVREYRDNPKADFHSMVAEMAGIPRKQAKGINLGMIYGMGKNKLAAELDLSVEEATALLKTYNDRVPFVKGMTKAVMNKLDDPRSSGHLRSLLGRRCRFDLWEPDSFDMHKALPRDEALQKYGTTTRLKRAYTYKSLNRLIQASAADITKKAMLDVCEQGQIPMLQVHDELAFSVENVEEARELSSRMEGAVPMEIPMRCDIEIGPSWGECEEVD